MTEDSVLSSRPLTARNLEDFAACPLKFMLSVTASKEETHRLLGGEAMLTRAVRRTLHEMLVVGSDGSLPPTAHEDLLARFERHFEGRYCADSREEDELREVGRRVLLDYAARTTADADDGCDRRVVATSIVLEGAIDGEPCQAAADAAFATDDGLEIVRFTLARKPPSAAELGRHPATIILRELASQHYGDSQVSVAVDALRHGKRIAASPADEQLEEAREAIVRLARTVRAAREFGPVRGDQCRWCRSKRRCPQWSR